MGMKELVDELRARRERALAMGGAAAIAQQRAAGKLTVRERIGRLFAVGVSLPVMAGEILAWVARRPISWKESGSKVRGRPASLIAYDFTVMAGFMARTAEVAFIDDVIDARETRPVILRTLDMAATKKVERPWKKHGVVPV